MARLSERARLAIATITLLLLDLSGPGDAINCFTCSSLNSSDVNCEDPFNPAMSTYKEKCMVPKQGHIGVFPANFCIKIRGTNAETSELMVIRACAMKTMDSQCGVFRYQEHTMTGCILTCDFDGCNSAVQLGPTLVTALVIAFAVVQALYTLVYSVVVEVHTWGRM